MVEQFAVRKILVPLDGSEYGERALPWAAAIAGSTAELILLEVVPPSSSVRDFTGKVISTAEQIASGYHDMATDQLGDIRSRWFPDRENVTLVIAEGDPTEQIITTSTQHNADLIVMSSRGRGAIGRFASGSVADRVMRHAPLPVCVIGPEGPIDKNVSIKRVIAPVTESALSEGALPVAAGLALHTDVEVHVVHVLAPEVDEMIVPLGGAQRLPATFPEDVLVAREAGAREFVEKFVSRAHAYGARAVGDVYTGRTNDTLSELIEPGDLLVLASHGRKGVPRWVLGSTAMKLIQQSRAPIVVVTREYLESVAEY